LIARGGFSDALATDRDEELMFKGEDFEFRDIRVGQVAMAWRAVRRVLALLRPLRRRLG
jgi:hypothetical protein